MAFTKINAAGIGTTETVTVDGLTVINDGSFGGNLTVSGVLTYEDVTNVDSVGLITARNGIVVGSGITLSKDGDIFATGITTVSGNVKVGTGITLSPDGDVFFTGIATGNGSGLTALNASQLTSGTVPTARLGSGTASSSTFLRGDSTFAAVTSTTINSNTNNYLITGTGTADTLQGESGLTYDGTTLSNDAVTRNIQAGYNYLLVGSSDANGVSITLDGDSNGDGAGVDYAYIEHNTDGDLVIVGDNPANASNIIFKTNSTTERLRIDSSGRVLIGTTTEGNGDADEFTIANVGGGNMGMTIRSATGALGNIFFSDGTSGDSEYRGMIQYGHNNDSMRFSTSATERARIDSSGKFNVGGTTSDAKFTVIDSSNPDIAMRYNGTDGGHATRLLFMDKRGVINAQVANNLQNDGVGTAAAHLEFATATGGTLSTAVRITDDGHVRKLRQPIFGYRGGSAWTTISNGQSPALALTTAVISSSDYNTSNYRFTAPTTGYYWFGCNLYTKHASMDTSSPHYISGGIRINGASQTESNTIQHYQNASDGDTGYFISLFHYLNASDYASIVLNANGADFQYYGAHCYFYGWLVA